MDRDTQEFLEALNIEQIKLLLDIMLSSNMLSPEEQVKILTPAFRKLILDGKYTIEEFRQIAGLN